MTTDNLATPPEPNSAALIDSLRSIYRRNPTTAWVQHCHIALACMDEGADHATANRVAAVVMVRLFGVDTRSNPNNLYARPEAAV
jgi:hypothetical protein